ncbi:MAG: hypothetical protein HQ559_07285 [Lentisphaerae bacterium]|nr:hypothetical protein [Lentisphaerota bacterium]
MAKRALCEKCEGRGSVPDAKKKGSRNRCKPCDGTGFKGGANKPTRKPTTKKPSAIESKPAGEEA